MKNVTIELPTDLAITAIESALYKIGNTFCIDEFKRVCAKWSITYDTDNYSLIWNNYEVDLHDFSCYPSHDEIEKEMLEERKRDYKYLSDNLENARIETELEQQLEKIKNEITTKVIAYNEFYFNVCDEYMMLFKEFIDAYSFKYDLKKYHSDESYFLQVIDDDQTIGFLNHQAFDHFVKCLTGTDTLFYNGALLDEYDGTKIEEFVRYRDYYRDEIKKNAGKLDVYKRDSCCLLERDIALLEFFDYESLLRYSNQIKSKNIDDLSEVSSCLDYSFFTDNINYCSDFQAFYEIIDDDEEIDDLLDYFNRMNEVLNSER